MTAKDQNLLFDGIARSIKATGKTGATATPVTLAGGTTSGAPSSGAHLKGEVVWDDAGIAYYCTVAGTPGTWVLSRPPGILAAVIDGAGSALTTGAKGAYVSVPYNCVITKWRILADVAGAVVIDVWKDTYANFPPVNADSIVASAKPTITATNQKAESTTLTGWTTTLTAGDILEFEVESATTITRARLELFVTPT